MRRLVLCVLLALLLPLQPARAGQIHYMTEENPPFNFQENGRLQGIAVDLLLAIHDVAGLPLRRDQIRLLPWPRAYRILEKDPDAALFSTARTRRREHLFQWVGPITTLTIGVIARRNRHLRPRSIAELNGLRIGTIRNGAPEQLLLEGGLEARWLDRVTTPEQNIRKLAAGRIDALAFNREATWYLMGRLGLDRYDYEMIYVLDEALLYYAYNPGVDAMLIDRLNRALLMLRTRDSAGASTYQRIIGHYLGPETPAP